MTKYDFNKNELEIIGKKISFLIRKKRFNQVQIGEMAFQDKSREGSKQFMKRICLGQVKGLKKEDIIKILDVLGVSWDEFQAFKIDDAKADETFERPADTIEFIFSVWPEGRRLVSMYADALALNNNELAEVIKKHMAESMRKAAADLIKK